MASSSENNPSPEPIQAHQSRPGELGKFEIGTGQRDGVRKAVRLVLVSGFLGSGKTTLIRSLVDEFVSLGLRVGVITNDQAQGLVDTVVLKSVGATVEEVPGGCFCCRFQDLTGKVGLIAKQADILLCEPVGSCTDVVATVINPLKAFYPNAFEFSPLVVLVDPSSVHEFLTGDLPRKFTSEIGYVFDKQLEEAEIIVLSKTDTLSSESSTALGEFLQKLHPGRTVLPVSTFKALGVDELATLLLTKASHAIALLKIDYDLYAKGEAALGWLNTTVSVSGHPKFDARMFSEGFMTALQASFTGHHLQIAHVKFVLRANGESMWGNLSKESERPVLGGENIRDISSATIVLNARVQSDPKSLESIVSSCLHETASKTGSTVRINEVQSFSPPYPKPPYRMAGLSPREAFRQFRDVFNEIRESTS